MSARCPSCGGVLGRECFNPEECAWITQDMQRRNKGTLSPGFDADDMSQSLKVYESSCVHRETGERLISVATRGRGMRLTEAQATDLRDWLNEWLSA